MFRRNEDRVIAQQNVETTFDLIVIRFSGTVQQFDDTIDDHLIREEITSEDVEQIHLSIPPHLRSTEISPSSCMRSSTYFTVSMSG